SIRFPYVDRRNKKWFMNNLKDVKPCIFGMERSLDIIENEENTDVKLSIEYIRSKIYSVTLDEESIWPNKRIANAKEMKKCIDKIVTAIENNIETGFSGNPKYVVPRSLVSIKFNDEKLYPFITHNNFNIEMETCSDYAAPRVETRFFDGGKRAYLAVPMMAAKRLNITLPGEDGKHGGSKTFDLTGGVIKSWEAKEFTVDRGDISYSRLPVDLSGFLKENKGTVLFFAANTKRFYGMVEMGTGAMRSSIELLNNRGYWIYFVPDDIDNKIVKFIPKHVAGADDIKNILDFLKQIPEVDKVYNHWEEWLDTYQRAMNDTVND
ncbi:MAG: hypothetical protein GY940_31500, partial [bacterium]|nr:hypothetical protein [bacterium]